MMKHIFSPAMPSTYAKQEIHTLEISESIADFFGENFGEECKISTKLTEDGFVSVSYEGFACLLREICKSLFDSATLKFEIKSESKKFSIDIFREKRIKLRESDIAKLSDIAEMSGFAFEISKNKITLSADIKRSASLPIYARDRSIMYKAFVSMFYVAVG